MTSEDKLRLCEKENEWAVAIIKKLQAEQDRLYQLAYTSYGTSYKEEWKDEQKQVIALEKLNERYRKLISVANRLLEIIDASGNRKSHNDDIERAVAVIKDVEDYELLYDLLARR